VSGRRRQRIEALAIPPAWTDVWICARADGHLQATGVDDRGRKQYLYHERWRALRDAATFDRLVVLARALPRVRAAVTAQLRRRTLDEERVLAGMVRILDLTAIRVGNEA
jgi:DNA topoisomerase-1